MYQYNRTWHYCSLMVSFANNRSGQKLLCRNTFISVMKPAELWNCDNLSTLQRLPRKRTLLSEAQVGSRFMVVAEIIRQRSLEMATVQDDVVVQTFPSNRADESLGVWILPWTLWCCQNLLHSQRLDSQSNLSTVPAVPIADEVMRSLSVGECFYDLLCTGHYVFLRYIQYWVIRDSRCAES